MGKVIVLVSCVSKKADTPQKAKDLYISDLFKKSLAYACSLEPDGIFILSALHHLLPLDEVVAPYNKTLNTMRVAERRQWAATVLKQLKERFDLEHDRFVILAGKNYYRNLVGENGIINYELPLGNLSIGQRLHELNKHLLK